MSDLWTGALIDARIWHGRSGDVARQFRYRAPYLALPLTALEEGRLPIALDGRGLWQLRRRDYGARDGSSLAAFIREQLAPHGLSDCEVTLVTLPRSAGYGFNPVSFWCARDAEGLRAVLAEVSNTFGERHLYMCRHDDTRPIAPGDRLSGEKLFHVSPFLPRAGRYVFRFDTTPGRFGAWIDWIGEDGEVRLGTAMVGVTRALTAQSLRRATLRAPLAAQKVIGLIHWQALKLFLRGVKYRSKPTQLARAQSGATLTERKYKTGDDHV